MIHIEREGAVCVLRIEHGKVQAMDLELMSLLEGGPDYVKKFVPALCYSVQKLFTFPRPVIAAVNGHAIAGGCIFVCACDYRIMAEGSARFGVPELLVGVPFPPIVLEVLRFILTNTSMNLSTLVRPAPPRRLWVLVYWTNS